MILPVEACLSELQAPLERGGPPPLLRHFRDDPCPNDHDSERRPPVDWPGDLGLFSEIRQPNHLKIWLPCR